MSDRLPMGALKQQAAEHGIPLAGVKAFHAQRATSKQRGIDFLFTLPDWWAWWQTDNRWQHRGRTHGCFVMARRNDTGPYAPGNVYCITGAENMREVWGGPKPKLPSLTKKPGGRRPLGERAMTKAERDRKSRDKRRSLHPDTPWKTAFIEVCDALGCKHGGVSYPPLREVLAAIVTMQADLAMPHPISRSDPDYIRRRDAMATGLLRIMEARASGIPKAAVLAFNAQCDGAQRRGIPVLFSLEEWWAWWKTDDRWLKRGRKHGAQGLVMARKNDEGPYSAENVYCTTISQNSTDALLFRKRAVQASRAKVETSDASALVR